MTMLVSDSTTSAALRTLFDPKVVAVVGVSRDPIKRGRQVIRNVMSGGFAGKVYGVGRGLTEADGAPCLPDLQSILEPVDVAFLALAADTACETLRQCKAIGVKVAIVGAAGFAENGTPDGIARQAELRKVAAELGIRIVGPNCNGIYNAHNGLALGFNAAHATKLAPGNIAILSHSGALFSVMAGYLRTLRVGISLFVSAGNEADLDLLDYLEFAIEHEQTSVIALLLDALSDGERFRQLGERASAAGKRIVALKVGVSDLGAKAALAHSSRLAGSAAAYQALFEASGVAAAATLEGLMTTTAILGFYGRAAGGLGAFTTSGAGASLVADIASRHGVPLPALPGATLESISAHLQFSQAGNPVDLGIFERGRSGMVPSLVAADPAIGAMMALVNPLDPNSGVPTLTEDLALARRSSGKPLVVVVPGGLPSGQVERYEAAGMRVFSDTESTVAGLGALLAPPVGSSQHRVDAKSGDAVLAASLLGIGRPLTEPESLMLLGTFGVRVVPTILCRDVDEMIAAADKLGWPVVAKGVREGVAHKTEAGLVRIDLRGPDAMRAAYAAFGNCEQVAIQPFIRGKAEAIVGVTWSSDVGMMLMAGLGGIYAEALREVVIWSVPATAEEIECKLAASALGRMLTSARWGRDAARVAVLDTLQRLQAFASVASAQLKAVDVNPLILLDDGAIAVDALVVPRRSLEGVPA
jgi:acyl-CoA synthetase (NDP forming)